MNGAKVTFATDGKPKPGTVTPNPEPVVEVETSQVDLFIAPVMV